MADCESSDLGVSCGGPSTCLCLGVGGSWTSSKGLFYSGYRHEIWVDGDLRGQGLGKHVQRSCLHSQLPKRTDVHAHVCVRLHVFVVIGDANITHIPPSPAPWDTKEHLFSALHLGTELGTSIYAVAKFISFLEKVFPSLPFNCISVCSLGREFPSVSSFLFWDRRLQRRGPLDSSAHADVGVGGEEWLGCLGHTAGWCG